MGYTFTESRPSAERRIAPFFTKLGAGPDLLSAGIHLDGTLLEAWADKLLPAAGKPRDDPAGGNPAFAAPRAATTPTIRRPIPTRAWQKRAGP